MASNSTYTRWGIIGSGEGGGRIVSQYLTGKDNDGVDDRVSILNTNRSDLGNIFDSIDGYDENSEVIKESGVVFSEQEGVGNFWPRGASCAQDDISKIAEGLSDMVASDAVIHVTAVGGGTGNGSTPYVIEQFKDGFDDAPDQANRFEGDIAQIAFAVWPFYDEFAQRQFNAVCGLSRLLKSEDGSQNADMVLLAANSHLGDAQGDPEGHTEINHMITTAIELMISAGRNASPIIDVEDYIRIPSQLDAYHFAPAVATDINGQIIQPEAFPDKALKNTFVPLDIETSSTVYMVVRAPENMIGDEIAETEITRTLQSWIQDKGIHARNAQTTLSSKPERGTDVDVLLMFGGFDLDPLISHSKDEFEDLSDSLPGGNQLSRKKMELIEDNLESYLSKNRNQK